MSKIFLKLSIVCASSFLFTACDTVRNSLGLDHYRPDEYSSAPAAADLSLPRDYKLRPPKSGETLPSSSAEDNNTTEHARKLLTGGATPSPVKKKSHDATAQSIIAQARQGQAVDPNIRKMVDQEAPAHSGSVLGDKLQQISENARSIFKPSDTPHPPHS